MKTLHNVHFFRDPALPGIEVRQVRKSRHAFPDHVHETTYAIGLMAEGGCYCRGTADHETFVSPGEIALINPGQVHSGVPLRDRHATYRMLYVDVACMASVAEESGAKPPAVPQLHPMVARHPALYRHLLHACRLLEIPGAQLHTESALVTALCRAVHTFGSLKTAMPKTGREPATIRIARELLSEELDRRISLSEAARAAGLSRYHFLRVFKRETGLSPHAFRTQRRVEASKRLLRSGMPAAQVALEVGFSDQSHFTNTFRRLVGATPRQYLSG